MPISPTAQKASTKSRHGSKRARRDAKRAAKQARDIATQRLNAKAQRELEKRQVAQYESSWELDIDAMYRHDSLDDRPIDEFALVVAYVDWLEGRDRDGVQHRGRAHWRQTNIARALDGQHAFCAWTPIPTMPGAVRPSESCNGCVYSYPQPTLPDASILDVRRLTATDRARLAHIVRGDRHFRVLPDYATRQRDVEANRWRTCRERAAEMEARR